MTWRSCLLGDVVTLKRGYDLPHRDRVAGRYPIVSSGGVSGSHAEAKVRGPGVITGRYGTLGEVYYVQDDFWPLNTSLYVRDFKGNHPRFVAYFLRTLGLGAQNAAGAVPGVNRNHLHALKVRVPEPPVQRRIAEILGAYDGLIENNTRRIAILEEMAWRLYKEWFVRFRFPGYEQVRMVDSLIGPIPEGWAAKPLGDVCARITDGAHHSPKSIEGHEGKPMASVKDMHDWGLDLEGCRRISIADFELLERNSCRPRKGDILIAKDGANLNKHTFLMAEDQEVVLLSSIAIITPSNGVCGEFLCQQLKEAEVSKRIKRSVSGAAIPRIILKDFKRITLTLPPLAIQSVWERLASPSLNLCRNLIRKNQNLRTQRDHLLPKLISGEIDVSEAPSAEEVAAA